MYKVGSLNFQKNNALLRLSAQYPRLEDDKRKDFVSTYDKFSGLASDPEFPEKNPNIHIRAIKYTLQYEDDQGTTMTIILD